MPFPIGSNASILRIRVPSSLPARWDGTRSFAP